MVLLATLALSSLADAAGVVYVNGVRADGLRSFDFKGVNVMVDENGDIWIDGPQYRISVSEEAKSEAQHELGAGVPQGKYWLVTQDNQSTGHTVEVIVNGVMVKKIRSGEPQVILDLQPHLKLGTNTVLLNALPGPRPEGGAFFVYVGTGQNAGGTVQLEKPEIAWSRNSASSVEGDQKSYKLRVE